MAGNTVVVKPSANSVLAPTMTLHRIAKLLPSGVVNILTGFASRIGDAIFGQPWRNFGYEGVTRFQGYHSIAGAPESLL